MYSPSLMGHPMLGSGSGSMEETRRRKFRRRGSMRVPTSVPPGGMRRAWQKPSIDAV
ncbi:MAG: hypothetical protein ACLR23_08585 [Clostridia bacterium]